MKKSSALLIAATLLFTACGSLAQLASSDNGQRFQDGIYSNTPAFRTKSEKEVSKSETEALVEKTKESPIYLFGDKKDTVMIPENMSATIKYDQKLGGTVVTVGENPYDWRYDLENNYGYTYGPYSLGSSWYWSRHYSPWYSWSYSPWRYHGWYDPYYYGGWYDPWYYGGWYNPYYYGGWYGWYDPWYYGAHWHHHGWYDPYWDHHHHPGFGRPENQREVQYVSRYETGSGRATTSTSLRRGSSTSRSTASRLTTSASRPTRSTATRAETSTRRPSTAVSGASSSNRPVSTGARPNYRRPAVSPNNQSSTRSEGISTNRASSYDRSSSSYSRSSSSYNRSSSSYSRSSSSSSYSSGSRSSYSGGGSSGGYSRSSSSGSRR